MFSDIPDLFHYYLCEFSEGNKAICRLIEEEANRRGIIPDYFEFKYEYE